MFHPTAKHPGVYFVRQLSSCARRTNAFERKAERRRCSVVYPPFVDLVVESSLCAVCLRSRFRNSLFDSPVLVESRELVELCQAMRDGDIQVFRRVRGVIQRFAPSRVVPFPVGDAGLGELQRCVQHGFPHERRLSHAAQAVVPEQMRRILTTGQGPCPSMLEPFECTIEVLEPALAANETLGQLQCVRKSWQITHIGTYHFDGIRRLDCALRGSANLLTEFPMDLCDHPFEDFQVRDGNRFGNDVEYFSSVFVQKNPEFDATGLAKSRDHRQGRVFRPIPLVFGVRRDHPHDGSDAFDLFGQILQGPASPVQHSPPADILRAIQIFLAPGGAEKQQVRTHFNSLGQFKALGGFDRQDQLVLILELKSVESDEGRSLQPLRHALGMKSQRNLGGLHAGILIATAECVSNLKADIRIRLVDVGDHVSRLIQLRLDDVAPDFALVHFARVRKLDAKSRVLVPIEV